MRRFNVISLAAMTTAALVSQSAMAATFTSGYTAGSGLLSGAGQTLFVDSALAGGGDARHDSGFADWAAEISGVWTAGQQISLTGIAIPIFAGAGTTNTTANGTFTMKFYDIGADNDFSGNTTDTLVGSKTVSFTGNTSPGTGVYYANFDTPLTFVAAGNGVAISFANTASLRLKINTSGVARETLGSGAAITSNGFFRMSLAGYNLGDPTIPTWNQTGGGTWGTAGNWSSAAVPDASGVTAVLGGSITAPATVNLDGARTVGTLKFDSLNAYTLAAGTGGSLMMNAGSAAINVVSGSHAISAPVSLDSNTVATIAGTNDLSLGAVSGIGTLTKEGTGSITLTATPSHAGTTINAGRVILGTGSGSPVALSNVTLGTGGTLDYRNATSTYSTGDFTSGSAGAIRVGAGTLDVPASAGNVGEVDQLTLTIASGATLTASGFTGGYELAVGQKVNLAGTFVAPAVTVFNDNTLGVADDEARAVGAAAITGNLILDGNSAASTDGLIFQLPQASGSGAADVLNVSGSLSKFGANAKRITVVATDGALSGNYTLINHNGGSVAASEFEVVLTGIPGPTRVTYAADTSTANQVKIVQATSGLDLTWTGANSATWDLNTTQNFVQTGTSTPETFYNLDTVRFDDSSAVKNVDLAGTTLIAKQVIVDTASTYTFTRTAVGDGLTGPSALIKRGTGKLIVAYNLDFDGANGTTYRGPISVEAGTLSLSGGITGATGNLSATTGVALSGGATLELYRSGLPSALATYSFPISGSGTIVKRGDNATVSGNNTAFTGLIRIEEGLLTFTNSGNAVGTSDGGIEVVNSGAVRFNGPNGYVVNDAISINSNNTTTQHLGFGGSAAGTINGLVSFQAPGTIQIDNGSSANLAGGVSAVAGLTISGAGSITLGDSSINGDVVRSNAAALNFAGNATITGTLVANVADGRINLNAAASNTAPHTVTVDGVTLAAGATSATAININNNILAIHYTGSSPLAGIRQLILDGRDDDNTNSNVLDAGESVIYSALLPAANRDIGYSDDGSVVRVRMTVLGDADLDGGVGFSDLLALAQNYQLPQGDQWFEGDFNYSNAVDFDDLLILAQNYNGSLSLAAASIDAGGNFAADFALARSLVPEPGAFAMVGMLGAMRRRRPARA